MQYFHRYENKPFFWISFESFLNLEFGRQIGLMFGLAASVAIGVALALWLMVDKDFKPLYASLEQLDSTSIIEILDSNRINYRIDNRSGALLVDADQIHQARLSLASAGMPADRNMGFELLDQGQKRIVRKPQAQRTVQVLT